MSQHMPDSGDEGTGPRHDGRMADREHGVVLLQQIGIAQFHGREVHPLLRPE